MNYVFCFQTAVCITFTVLQKQGVPVFWILIKKKEESDVLENLQKMQDL